MNNARIFKSMVKDKCRPRHMSTWDDKFMDNGMVRLPEIVNVHYYDSNLSDHYFDNITATASGMRYPLGVNRTPKWPLWMHPTDERYRFVCDLSHMHPTQKVDIVLNRANFRLHIQDRFHKGVPNEECLKNDSDLFQLNMDGYNVCEGIPIFQKMIQLPHDSVPGSVHASISQNGLLTINVARLQEYGQKNLGRCEAEEDGGGVTVPIPIGEDSSSSSSDDELGVRE